MTLHPKNSIEASTLCSEPIPYESTPGNSPGVVGVHCAEELLGLGLSFKDLGLGWGCGCLGIESWSLGSIPIESD